MSIEYIQIKVWLSRTPGSSQGPVCSTPQGNLPLPPPRAAAPRSPSPQGCPGRPRAHGGNPGSVSISSSPSHHLWFPIPKRPDDEFNRKNLVRVDMDGCGWAWVRLLAWVWLRPLGLQWVSIYVFASNSVGLQCLFDAPGSSLFRILSFLHWCFLFIFTLSPDKV